MDPELEAQAGLQEKTDAKQDAERAARIETEKRATALTVENAHLEERASAAERWAGELTRLRLFASILSRFRAFLADNALISLSRGSGNRL